VLPAAPTGAVDDGGTVSTHTGRGGSAWPICITSNDGNYRCTTCYYQGGSTSTSCVPRIPPPPARL
jgi:hypothetical protein